MEQLVTYCAEYAEDFAVEQIEQLTRTLNVDLKESPLI